MNQPRAAGGKFGSPYKEPRGKAIALRLPQSLDEAVRAAAGDNLKSWIEDAIALKLKQELEQGQLSATQCGTEKPTTTTSNEAPIGGRLDTRGKK